MIYGISGVIWILLSDVLLTHIAQTPERIMAISVWKGVAFVAATTILIYLLVHRAMTRMERSCLLLKESDDRLRHLVDGYDEYAVIMMNPSGVITSWNPGAEKMTGYDAREAVGRPLAILYTPESAAAGDPERAVAAAAEAGQFKEEGYRRRKDGSLFIAYVAMRPLYDTKGTLIGLSSISRDITERKNSENKISHLNRLYAILSRVNATIVRTRDRDALFAEICRTIVEEGKFVMAWIGLADKEGTRVIPFVWHGAADGYLDDLTIVLDDSPLGQGPVGTVLKTNTSFICNDIEHNPVMAPWREEALRRQFRSMAAFPIRSEDKVLGALAIYSTESFFFDADEIRLLDEVADDISFSLHTLEEEMSRQRAEAELHRLNDELELRVKQRTAELELANQELESFNYSVSHDLRSPLTVINGFSQTLTDECPLPNEKCHFYVDRIKVATNRMAKLIDDLLNLTRVNRKPLQKQTFNMSTMAESVAHELNIKNPRRSQVTFTNVPELETTGDPGLIRIVLTNLLGNAWKYTAPKPEPVVEFGRTQQDGMDCFFVRDNGVGFDMTYEDKLFKPFERLHSLEEFEGSGIGLATVKRIVNRHGGAIWAEGAPGKGATFYFTLP